MWWHHKCTIHNNEYALTIHQKIPLASTPITAAHRCIESSLSLPETFNRKGEMMDGYVQRLYDHVRVLAPPRGIKKSTICLSCTVIRLFGNHQFHAMVFILWHFWNHLFCLFFSLDLDCAEPKNALMNVLFQKMLCVGREVCILWLSLKIWLLLFKKNVTTWRKTKFIGV